MLIMPLESCFMMGGFCFVCGRGMVLDKSAGFTGSYSSRPKRMSLQLPPSGKV